jgi:putative SOS response-associated peptidase YedK
MLYKSDAFKIMGINHSAKEFHLINSCLQRRNTAMCGRFTLQTSSAVLAKAFDLQDLPDIEPRYNIAPSQLVAAVRHVGDHNKLDFLTWGLHPSWSKDITHTPINARSETVHNKPIFGHAIKFNRCIIPATGFYECVLKDNHKQPYYIRLSNGGIMGIAGLWERWNSEDGTEVETCCLLTTAANELMKPIRERMPVILHPDDYGLWISRNMHEPQELQRLYQPYPSDLLIAYHVPDLVNNPRFDSAACIVQM